MRHSILLVVVLAIGFITVSSQKPRKLKGAQSHMLDIEKKLQLLLQEEDSIQNELEAMKEEEEDNEDDDRDPEYFPDDGEVQKDPCQDEHCGAGRECITDADGVAKCPCVKECLQFDDERRVVCSNYNNTWPSDCKLHQIRCLCAEGHSSCPDEKYQHMHIDYYGRCQAAPNCEKDEMSDFPRRMREWLFNIMQDMADQGGLSESFTKMGKEGDENEKWVIAAVWKWCLLDDHPADRSVSRHELFPLRAPLYTMEHCIAPFLNSCDPNDDHVISLKEWVSCLELNNEHIEEMEDLCDEIRPEAE